MESETLIGTIEKKADEEVRVYLGEFHGPRVDVRTYFQTDDGEFAPTRKGVMLRVDKLPELIDVLQKAYARAVKDKMLES